MREVWIEQTRRRQRRDFVHKLRLSWVLLVDIWLSPVQGAASDTFLLVFPLGLLPQGVFPDASVLGRRTVAVLLVSGNSEAISVHARLSPQSANPSFTFWVYFC